MAVPAYTEDLTDITLSEGTTGFGAYGGGGAGLSASPDLSMQGTNCVDKQITNADKGIYYDNGSGITLGSGDHVWIWHFCGTPGLTDTRANKGASVLVGTGSTAYCQYHVEGNDTYGAAGRVGRCYPIDYSVRTANAAEPYRTLTGSPGANPSHFGGGLSTTASVKGANVGIDAMRYGTGAYLTAGELISAGDGSDDPCTLGGFNTQSDSVSNRWGILTELAGGYELQGRFVIGQNNSQTATLCRFRDSDQSIAFVDTIHAASDFTQIIIDHASTRCEMTNINLTALGTTNRGRFTVNSANPTVEISGGTWTGVGPTTLRSNCSVDGLTWRLADAVTANDAEIIGSTFDRLFSSVAVFHTDLTQLTGNNFISDGTGHAVDYGTVTASETVTWDNTLSGYVSGTTGDPITTGTSGNEAIRVTVNSGQKLTINVAAGATIPSVKNDGSGTVAVLQSVSVEVTVSADGSPLEGAAVYLETDPGGVEVLNGLTNASGVLSGSFGGTTPQAVTGWVRSGSGETAYQDFNLGGSITSNGYSQTALLSED